MLAVIMAGMFLFVILVQTVLHRAERKDLYNRIMARDLTEYQVRSGERKADTPYIERNPLKKKLEKNEKERIQRFQSGIDD